MESRGQEFGWKHNGDKLAVEFYVDCGSTRDARIIIPRKRCNKPADGINVGLEYIKRSLDVSGSGVDEFNVFDDSGR